MESPCLSRGWCWCTEVAAAIGEAHQVREICVPDSVSAPKERLMLAQRRQTLLQGERSVPQSSLQRPDPRLISATRNGSAPARRVLCYS